MCYYDCLYLIIHCAGKGKEKIGEKRYGVLDFLPFFRIFAPFDDDMYVKGLKLLWRLLT